MSEIAALLVELDALRALPAETEWLDFKEARQTFDIDELGRYVSALANEANLHGRRCGWLILGVKDRRDPLTGLRPISGSAFKTGVAAMNALKLQVAQGTSPSMSFLRVGELAHADCAAGSRVLMFEVPPAPRGMPVSWKGHHYGRVGESLTALGTKYEVIRAQSELLDWSRQAVDADVTSLDEAAVRQGRALYAKKHPARAAELVGWSDERFLRELDLTRNGKLTRAAVVLFGSASGVSRLDDVSPRLTWKLMDGAGAELDYQHFKPPFVLAIDELVSKLRQRIHTVRILPPGQLAPLELPAYDDWVIREALLNCVAHQDYASGGRVVVSEWPDSIWFSNEGSFIPGSVESVLVANEPVHRYRNPCLAEAMVELGLIDTIGSGIKRMYRTQRERYFPLPDFELKSNPASVRVCIHGRELDTAFSRALLSGMDLSLEEVIALDRVQKRKALAPALLKPLRRRGLVEGRGALVRISGAVAKAAGREVSYTVDRGLDSQHYKALVVQLLKLGPQGRPKINQLLLDKLPGAIAPEKRAAYIKTLLREMSRDGLIETDGGRTKAAKWRLKPASRLGQAPTLANE
ncbi:MAG: ATP-binding protein [Burkholderiaceae bacterium]